MREIEIKAHARDEKSVRAYFDARCGAGHEVHKTDHYFRRPGAFVQALRIREHKGIIEFTCKKTSSSTEGEKNEEYEFQASADEIEKASSFFHALGFEDFFIKKKDGWEWMDGDAHVELLSVNDLGWFLEIEILLPFGSSDDEAEEERKRIDAIMKNAGVSRSDYEMKSYREMILGSEYGIQG